MARPKKVPPKATATASPVDVGVSGSLIPVLKSTALSTDVGAKVVAWIADARRFDDEAASLVKSGETTRRQGLELMTMGIVKAVRADSSINLATVFEEKKSPTRARMYNQLYIGLGFKTPVDMGKGKKRLDWTKDVAPYVAPENANDPTRQQKDHVRQNLAHQLTKAIHASIKIVEAKIDIRRDKSGVVMLTGPAIKSHFGEASVLLNEKQTVKTLDKKGNVTGEKTLKAKPSFTEIARMGAESHGKIMTTRVDSRAVVADPAKHVADLCGMIVKALEKINEPDDAMRTSLESVRSAIEKILD